jgi:hypothetical protein
MDFTFGLDGKELAKYGAKAVVFDAIRGQHNDVPIHPYVKVSPDADPAEAQVQACRASNAEYFVVRASSRYELLPGTAGMTDSERFVNCSQIGERIHAVRKPTGAYFSFVGANELEPEKVIPVIVQPMWAGSFGMVTEHPNQRMTMVDYFEDNDSEKIFRERSFSSCGGEKYRDTQSNMSELHRLNSFATLRGGDKNFYARYDESGLVAGKTENHRQLMDLARRLFEPLNIFGDDWSCQGEYGPDRASKELVLYQLKPFMPKRKGDFRLDKAKANADVAFGICRDLELPVVRIKGAHDLRSHDFDEFIDPVNPLHSRSSRHMLLAKNAFESGSRMRNIDDLAKISLSTLVYQSEATERARQEYKGDVCLAMPSYSYEDGQLFLNLLKPTVVVVSDDMRAGMIHNRTNLIQSVPVTIFGNDLFESDAGRVRISSDGINAVVEKL